MFSSCSNCCSNCCSSCCVPHEGEHPEGRIVEDYIDRSRAVEISQETNRELIPVTSYQPIDTVTRTVEIPVIITRERNVPKLTIEEKIVEVPKYNYQRVEKVVEVPEIKFVDKIVEIPQYHYQYKYVPKVEVKENVVTRPITETKYIEKIVEVPQVKEVVRYHDVETVEEIIRYVPKGEKIPEIWAKVTETPLDASSGASETKGAERTFQPIPQEAQQLPPQGKAAGVTIPGTPFLAYPPIKDPNAPELQVPRIEQVFRPKVVKNVEIQKHVPISVDVPVPYMVPKPLLVPVHVPVLKFRDHFVPVPVRRVVVPQIRWTNEVYEVECIKEKPFLQVQDVIKPVPCDVEINVHEFVDKAQPINPTELSQADIHAMWMRVNADLAEKRKEELGENYPYVKHPPGTVFGEPGTSQSEQFEGEISPDPEAGDSQVAKTAETADLEKTSAKEASVEGATVEETTDQLHDPLALHPGHPLSITYLQNQWIKKDTTTTHQMYTPEWFEAHHKGAYALGMQHPTQTQLSAEQAALFQTDTPAFGQTPWHQAAAQQSIYPPEPASSAANAAACKSSCCYDAEDPDAACCGPR